MNILAAELKEILRRDFWMWARKKADEYLKRVGALFVNQKVKGHGGRYA